MVRHLIFMSSSYSSGVRIAFDLCGKELNAINIFNSITRIKKECGESVSLSTHFINAKTEEWESVVESDSFFKGVKCVSSIRKFISLIKRDLVLEGIDIARYILTKKPCTHLELEKLTYFCYADYLCKTGQKMFNDSILAYRYGPVISSVYGRYNSYGSSKIDEYTDTKEHNLSDIELPAISRIMFSTYGEQKINSIEDTLKRYAKYSAGELINITHRQGSPWDRTEQSHEIHDELIQQFHFIEQ